MIWNPNFGWPSGNDSHTYGFDKLNFATVLLLVRGKSGPPPSNALPCQCKAIYVKKKTFFYRNPDERKKSDESPVLTGREIWGTDICSDWTPWVLIESQLQNVVFYKTQEGLPYFPKTSNFVLMRYQIDE